jgi:Tn3 transposase DDE domain
LEIRGDQFHVTRLEKLVQPQSARELRKRVQQILTKRQLTDLLLEVHGWTGFLKAFTRITTGRSVTEADVGEQIKLLACCLIAEGCQFARHLGDSQLKETLTLPFDFAFYLLFNPSLSGW